MKKNKRFKRNNRRFDLEAVMLGFGKFLKKLWKATLKSSLYAKDKAEILRLWIFVGVANVVGLATETTENPEIFLKELCDLCG